MNYAILLVNLLGDVIMNRLTEFDEEKNIFIADIYDTEYIDWREPTLDTEKVDKIVQRLGYYEQKAENGLLLELPCKEDTIIYEIVEECNSLVCHKPNCKKCAYYNPHINQKILSLVDIILYKDKFNETIFFTEEEANEKLKEMKK
jgi:hypothetical protein